MPPLVFETAAWLRFYTILPIPLLPGEPAPLAAPDAAKTAHAVPIAGALIGVAGGLVVILAWALRLPPFLSAALALAAIVIVTGGLAERALAVSAERLGGIPAPSAAGTRAGPDLVSYGAIALVLAILLRVGALEGLISLGTVSAALALVAAGALARAAAISYVLAHPARAEGEAEGPRVDAGALQRLGIVALVVGALAILPAYGIAPTIAGLAAAIGAAAVITTVAGRFGGDNRREIAGAAEQTAEIAFLVAVLVFARMP